MSTLAIVIVFFVLLAVCNSFERKIQDLEERIEELEGRIDVFEEDDGYDPLNRFESID